jgi:4-amino-4-deoxy-L-arabinose transferase-like glycosyltransferase
MKFHSSPLLNNQNSHLPTISLLAAITLFKIAYLLFVPGIAVVFDEAQYWSWAQSLDFGYFSKPPIIAWLIAASTGLAGSDSVFWVKLPATLLHFITAICIYFITKALYPANHKVAQYAAIIYITAPAIIFSSMLMTTDAPLLTFWALSFLIAIYAIRFDQIRLWIALGMAIGCGMLTKYAMIFFVLSFVIYALWADRRLLLKSGFYLSLIIAAIVLLPNILWNVDNHFVSFTHLMHDNIGLKSTKFSLALHPINALEFIASQFFILGPVFFAGILYLLYKGSVRRETEAAIDTVTSVNREKLLLSFFLLVFIAIVAQAFFKRAYGNWAAASYITALPLVTAFLVYRHIKLLKIGLAINITIMMMMYILSFYLDSIAPQKSHSIWQRNGEMITQICNNDAYKTSNLLFDDRKMIASMLYYARKCGIKRFYKWNPTGAIKDHYDLTTDISDKVGSNFLLITRHKSISEIADNFNNSEEIFAQERPLYKKAEMLYVYKLSSFKKY